MQNLKVGDKVTINASRSIPVSITGVILAIDYGDYLHTPETMVLVETNNAKLWVYAWRLSVLHINPTVDKGIKKSA